MSKFQVWDVPSASLIDEADDFQEIARTVQSLIDEEGPSVLDELSLSEERGETGQFVSYQGQEIMRSLHEHLTAGPAATSM